MLRGNGVGFKASKVHFSSTSFGFVLFTEAPKSEDEQGTHPFYRTRGLYQLLHLTNPAVCIRRRRQPLKNTRTTDSARRQFVPTANFETRQLSKFLTLSLLDRRVFDQGTDSRRTGSRRTGIIFDHAGLSHEGLDSNNFVVAQHTTYFEISSFSTNSEDSCFIL